MRAFIVAVMLVACATPALAAPVSFETELVDGRCRFIDDDGEVGHYALKRCPGLGGAQVYTEARMHTVALQFRWGKGAYRTGVKSGSIGLKLEWRGTGTKAAFKPHAAIVTAVIREFDKNHENETRHNVLAVIRIEQRNACLMAVIDQPGNKDALVLARATADASAPGFSCARDRPRVVGKPSDWAQQVIGFDGDGPN